jgi:RNA polymerase sigma-70 factor (ECF subfamily)
MEQALRTMYRDYAGALLRDAVKSLRDVEEARELVQECLLKAWQRCALFQGSAEIYAWLAVILRNLVIDRIRAGRGRPEPAGADEPPDLPDPGHGPAGDEDYRRLVRKLVEFHRAQPECGQILQWIVLDGLAPAEIAEALGIGPQAARQRLYRCREQFRQFLGGPGALP